MPLLPLPERASQDLLFLATLPSAAHVVEFCRQALDALATGSKKATLRHAATALGVELNAVAGAVMALALVFVEAAKVRRRARAAAPRAAAPANPPPLAARPLRK